MGTTMLRIICNIAEVDFADSFALIEDLCDCNIEELLVCLPAVSLQTLAS